MPFVKTEKPIAASGGSIKNYIIMRKIVVLSMVLSLFFLGCHKDGIYNPKEKIKTIYLQWENEPKELDQKWTWEKELLTAIELFHNNTSQGFVHFTYEKKRLVKIETPWGNTINIKYDGRHYDSLEELYPDGRTRSTIKFSHDKNKISKMEMKFYDYDEGFEKKSKNDVISIIEPFFPAEFTQSLKKTKSNMKNEAVYTSETTTTFTYDGDNLKEIKSEGKDSDGASWNDKYTYINHDKKSNPKYRFILGNDESGYALGVTSKNNPIEVRNLYSYQDEGSASKDIFTSNSTIKYEYVYDGKFPVEAKKIVRYDDGYNYQHTTFYEYQ